MIQTRPRSLLEDVGVSVSVLEQASSVKQKGRRRTRADKIPKRRKTSEHVTNIEIRIRMMMI